MIQKGKKSNHRIFESRLEIFFNGTVVEYNQPLRIGLDGDAKWNLLLPYIFFIITSGIFILV